MVVWNQGSVKDKALGDQGAVDMENYAENKDSLDYGRCCLILIALENGNDYDTKNPSNTKLKSFYKSRNQFKK